MRLGASVYPLFGEWQFVRRGWDRRIGVIILRIDEKTTDMGG